MKIILLITALAGGLAITVHLRQQNAAQEELARRTLETDKHNREMWSAMQQGAQESRFLLSTTPLDPKKSNLPITQHLRPSNAH
jgi:outer membrane lipopolysaccharide assembly protein LptE/RlpB